MESKGKNPGATYGGTWVMRDSQNGFKVYQYGTSD